MYKFSEKTPQPLDQCSDETLCQLVAGGSREAEEALVTRYNRLVRTCVRPNRHCSGRHSSQANPSGR